MPQYQTWEEFSRAAEKLYLADPMKEEGLDSVHESISPYQQMSECL